MTPAEAQSALEGLGPGSGGGRVTCRLEDGVAHVRLDHPGARASVTFRMMAELARVVVDLQGFDGHAVLLGTEDPAVFCAGGHLGELLAHLDEPAAAERMALAMSAVLDGLRDLPPPTVAVVHGLAVGGGAELATAADWRVLAPTAEVWFVHTQLGVVPGWGGAQRLARIVGHARALRWLARAERVSAAEALRVGFADEVDADPLAAAMALIAPLRGRADAVRAAKAQLLGDTGTSAQRFGALWGSPTHRAALAERGRR